MHDPGRLDAVVFDLDGTIVDTETVIFKSIAAVFEEHDLDFPMDRWLREAVGHVGHFDWRDDLAARAPAPVDREAVTRRQAQLEVDLMAAVEPRPGVVALIEELTASGVRISAASNSRTGWVRQQLERVALVHHFSALYGRDRVPRPKPEPDVYLAATRGVGADPSWSVAIEDSRAGVTAAVAAGLTTVACPNAITAAMDLSAAHWHVPSLEGVGVAHLRDLVAGRRE